MSPTRVDIEVGGPSVADEDRAWLMERLERAVELFALREPAAPTFARIALRLVGDVEMGRLHAQAVGDASTTDVLTWAERNGSGAIEVDLAICTDEAARRALEHGHADRDEVLLYTIHGLLHAIGFDDRTREQFEAMHAEETRMMAALGGRARVDPGEWAESITRTPGTGQPPRPSHAGDGGGA